MRHCIKKHLVTWERTCCSAKSVSALCWQCPGIKNKKKEVMCHSASGKPKSSESSLKLKQFCKSTQYMQQLSLCAFKLKINGCNFKNGRHAGHCPQVLIQIQINEEFKVRWRLGGQEKKTVQTNLLIGCLTGIQGTGHHQSQSISDVTYHSRLS